MSWYTTPLQIGYFFSLLMGLVFLIRGVREERLADRFLAFLMLILALELQDYTFGFAGINFLWTALNGFPREVSLLFGPAMYFYLQSQINVNFSLHKKHLLHLLPWGMVFLYFNFFFWQGSAAVQAYQQSEFAEGVDIFIWLVTIASYLYYFKQSIALYRNYQAWTKNQFSALNTVQLKWYRNFIYFMGIWVSCKVILSILDFLFDLNFFQDWWWNIPLAATALYIGLEGFRQKQSQAATFELQEKAMEHENPIEPELDELAKMIQDKMEKEQLFLHPELNLSELSKHLDVPVHSLSAAINQVYKKNFNDFINLFRIAYFEALVKEGKAKQHTLLSIAYDSGFNSKATFHRAYKKQRGQSPKEFLSKL